MRLKLLSIWLGSLPVWWGKFVEQMRRFKSVDWECIIPPGTGWAEQIRWLNSLAKDRLGIECKKGTHPNAACDFRPLYGLLFQEKYNGYDWWGWCDLDVLFGDLDSLLPLWTADVDVLTFKEAYLSGCFTILRNTEETREAFKHGKFREVMADKKYCLWDESGLEVKGLQGRYTETFLDVLKRAGLRVRTAPELYIYNSSSEYHPVEFRDGMVFDPATGDEKLLYHFTDDKWPIGETH